MLMEPRYKILLIIYEIVKSDPVPETYLVTPHQIILRQEEDWKCIETYLAVLAEEKLIIIKQLDKIAISITPLGTAKVKAIKKNFINDNFTLPIGVKKITSDSKE